MLLRNLVVKGTRGLKRLVPMMHVPALFHINLQQVTKFSICLVFHSIH